MTSRKGKAKRKSSYVKAPSLAPEMAERFELIVAVLSGELTVSAAARRAGMSRNRFQTLVHRATAGLIEGLSPKPPGRPKQSEQLSELKERQQQLERENRQLKRQAEMGERMMGVVQQVIRGEVSPSPKPRSRRKRRGPKEDDREGGSTARLEAATALRKLGLTAELAASCVGRSVATLRRWRRRRDRGVPLIARRGPGPKAPPAADLVARARDHVRELRGHCGADALRHAIDGLSRRQAARIKADTVTEMERERKANSSRVRVTRPGVLRGFDAMHLRQSQGGGFALIAADAAAPFRTSATRTDRYDGAAVHRLLAADFERHGAPLVLRMDRARCHQTDPLEQLLDDHGVLPLHGPPRLARYYGQLERQNREHRSWLAHDTVVDKHALARMLAALNGLWHRRTLGFRTAEQVWNDRPTIEEDRLALRDEVRQRATSLRESLPSERAKHDFPMRLAIEQALCSRGLLVIKTGGRC